MEEMTADFYAEGMFQGGLGGVGEGSDVLEEMRVDRLSWAWEGVDLGSEQELSIWVIVGEAESMATKGEGASSETGSKCCRLQITWWPQWSCQVWNPEFWRPAMRLRFPFKGRALPPEHFCSFPFPPHCLFAMHDLLVYWGVGVRKKNSSSFPIETCIKIL